MLYIFGICSLAVFCRNPKKLSHSLTFDTCTHSWPKLLFVCCCIRECLYFQNGRPYTRRSVRYSQCKCYQQERKRFNIIFMECLAWANFFANSFFRRRNSKNWSSCLRHLCRLDGVQWWEDCASEFHGLVCTIYLSLFWLQLCKEAISEGWNK